MTKKTILVVDDDEVILNSFKAILESDGYSVDTAESGQEAIDKSSTEFFNLALLDIKLPDMKGTEVLTNLQADAPKMIKIMVTGHATLENAVKAVNLGADAYIMKPVSPEELRKVVKEKLKEQEEVDTWSQEKVSDWIKDRVRKLESEKSG